MSLRARMPTRRPFSSIGSAPTRSLRISRAALSSLSDGLSVSTASVITSSTAMSPGSTTASASGSPAAVAESRTASGASRRSPSVTIPTSFEPTTTGSWLIRYSSSIARACATESCGFTVCSGVFIHSSIRIDTATVAGRFGGAEVDADDAFLCSELTIHDLLRRLHDVEKSFQDVASTDDPHQFGVIDHWQPADLVLEHQPRRILRADTRRDRDRV